MARMPHAIRFRLPGSPRLRGLVNVIVMQTRLRHFWQIVTTGYWFVPTVMSLCALAMAMLLLWIDRQYVTPEQRLMWLYTGGPDGAKTLLATVAGSVSTVAGVVFSITVAALSQASSQFGPRLLRNFMRDTSNQIVLGTFVATFLYCLMILRTIHAEQDGLDAFVPQASVTVSVLLAAISMGMLIFFIHHVSVSLQAPRVVAAVAADLSHTIASFAEAPEPADEGHRPVPPNLSERDDDQREAVPPVDAQIVRAGRDGYLQAVEYETLVELARRADVTIRLEHRAGDHVMERCVLARIWPAARVDDDLRRAVCRAVICGVEATPEQDVEFAIRQLVEVAVRALSPGINDPFTAINCIDALGAASANSHAAACPWPAAATARGRSASSRPSPPLQARSTWRSTRSDSTPATTWPCAFACWR
jgi:uncharacterized membrane protein